MANSVTLASRWHQTERRAPHIQCTGLALHVAVYTAANSWCGPRCVEKRTPSSEKNVLSWHFAKSTQQVFARPPLPPHPMLIGVPEIVYSHSTRRPTRSTLDKGVRGEGELPGQYLFSEGSVRLTLTTRLVLKYESGCSVGKRFVIRMSGIPLFRTPLPAAVIVIIVVIVGSRPLAISARCGISENRFSLHNDTPNPSHTA